LARRRQPTKPGTLVVVVYFGRCCPTLEDNNNNSNNNNNDCTFTQVVVDLVSPGTGERLSLTHVAAGGVDAALALQAGPRGQTLVHVWPSRRKDII